MKFRSFFLIILIILPLFCGCASANPPTEIAATTLPVYQFTSMLCDGTDLQVIRLVTENVSCLHDYTLQVSQMRAIESAQIIVQSGAGLEEFLADALSGAQYVIDSSADISIISCEHEEDDEHEDEHDHHGHNHEYDPHIWLSPENAKIMAQNICSGLTQQFPAYQSAFETNLSNLLLQLDQLQTYGEEQLSDLSCRELITFHDGFAYFAEAFDLTILEAVEEESGSEASAQELTRLIQMVQEYNLPAIFTETNGSTSSPQVISAETGTQIYSLDMAMAGEDYFESMYHNIDTIKEALG
ncbi:MAG: zinc ABC transporter substrate-binding protein [Oscillospiraceae bacterium]|nr:zinc ABC transporter substrate-binding protein [Oscillospiraceae bacterium]